MNTNSGRDTVRALMITMKVRKMQIGLRGLPRSQIQTKRNKMMLRMRNQSWQRKNLLKNSNRNLKLRKRRNKNRKLRRAPYLLN